MVKQPWDPQRVRVAFSQASALVEWLRTDDGEGRYRANLDSMVDEALDGAWVDDEAVERLAFLLHGLAVFGLLATTAAEELAQLPAERIRELIGQVLNLWLDETDV